MKTFAELDNNNKVLNVITTEDSITEEPLPAGGPTAGSGSSVTG